MSRAITAGDVITTGVKAADIEGIAVPQGAAETMLVGDRILFYRDAETTPRWGNSPIPGTHGHVIGDVTGLSDTLASLLAATGGAALVASSDASVSLLADYNLKFVRLTNATPTLALGLQASITYPTDFFCYVTMTSGGTIDAPAGVTLNGTDGANLTLGTEAAGAIAILKRVAADTWLAAIVGTVDGAGVETLLQGRSASAQTADGLARRRVVMAEGETLGLDEVPIGDGNGTAIPIAVGTSPVAVYADLHAGSSVIKLLTPNIFKSLTTPQGQTYAASVTLDYTPTTGNSTSLVQSIPCEGACEVSLDGVDGWVGYELRIRFTDGGGTAPHALSVITANGITVSAGSGVGTTNTLPDNGTMTAVLRVVSATAVTLLRWEPAGVFSMTAAADERVASLIPAGSGKVTVAAFATDANDWVRLPAGVAGTTITGWSVVAHELRTPDSSNATINGQDGDGTNEAAIPATTLWVADCVATDTWILRAWDELGAPITAIVPD